MSLGSVKIFDYKSFYITIRYCGGNEIFLRISLIHENQVD